MNKENCALKLVEEIILYYDARSKKHQTEECIKIVALPRAHNGWHLKIMKCLKVTGAATFYKGTSELQVRHVILLCHPVW